MIRPAFLISATPIHRPSGLGGGPRGLDAPSSHCSPFGAGGFAASLMLMTLATSAFSDLTTVVPDADKTQEMTAMMEPMVRIYRGIGLQSAILFVMSRYVPKVPAAIVVVVLGILAVKAFDLNTKHGVKIVGPAVRAMALVTRSTRSALVISLSRKRALARGSGPQHTPRN